MCEKFLWLSFWGQIQELLLFLAEIVKAETQWMLQVWLGEWQVWAREVQEGLHCWVISQNWGDLTLLIAFWCPFKKSFAQISFIYWRRRWTLFTSVFWLCNTWWWSWYLCIGIYDLFCHNFISLLILAYVVLKRRVFLFIRYIVTFILYRKFKFNLKGSECAWMHTYH